MDPNTTDLDTADLVLQAALQEVEEALRSLSRDANNERARVGDQNLALFHWRAELRRRMRTQQDLRAAIQISRESHIHNREVNEAPAAPVPPAGRVPPRAQQQPRAQQPPQEQQPLQRQQPRGTLDLVPKPDARAQSCQRADATTTPTVPPPSVLRECTACSESHTEFNMIQSSCSHIYFQGCVIHLLQNSLADESLFPPRCCRVPLPLEAARAIIDDELWARFEEKRIEQGDRHRTYCSDPACSRYILPVHVRGTTATCRACNRQTHLVELRSGCNHITLQERAELIAARNQPVPPAPQIVEQAAQFLIAQHDCYHEGAWKKLGISAECEECGDLMPDYIFECRHCGLQACNSCRIHRF
ncbi:hypothetical protein N7453_008227 [Penicillium expansum]|nr:hypothetical protein N7453_008227 [Penicillium expansum]